MADKKNALLIHDVNIAHFSFSLSTVLENSQSRDVFLAYLKTELNAEPLLFVEAVQALKQIPFPQQEEAAVTKAINIIDTFILTMNKDGTTSPASMEINISAPVKSHLVETFTEVNQHKNPAKWLVTKYVNPSEMFAKVKDSVMLELNSDTFPRFVRSKLWINFLKSKDRDFVNSMGSLKAAMDYAYTDESFHEHIVTDSDFKFLRRLSEDDYDWDFQGYQRLTSENSVISCFFNTKNYFPKVSWFNQSGCVAKFVGTLPYDMDYCAKVLLPGCNIERYDANAKTCVDHVYYDNDYLKKKFPKDISSSHRSCAVLNFEVFFPFPMTQVRRYLNCTSTDFDPEKEQIMLVHKPCTFPAEDLEKIPKRRLPKGWLELKNMCAYIFNRLDDQRTLFQQIHLFNAQGWASSRKLQKMILMKRGIELQKTLLDTLKKGMELSRSEDVINKTLQSCKIDEQRKAYQIKKQLDLQQQMQQMSQTQKSEHDAAAPVEAKEVQLESVTQESITA